MRKTAITLVMGAVVTAGLVASAWQGQGTDSRPQISDDPTTAKILAEFEQRVDAYVDIRDRSWIEVPKRPEEATPEQIHEHQELLGAAIRSARPDAKQGNLFTKDMEAWIRAQLDRIVSGTKGRQIRASVLDDNPTGIKFNINGRYPPEVPMSTMPPEILAALPKLPEELEFRFIGEHLILLCIQAQLVLDFIPNALPRV